MNGQRISLDRLARTILKACSPATSEALGRSGHPWLFSKARPNADGPIGTFSPFFRVSLAFPESTDFGTLNTRSNGYTEWKGYKYMFERDLGTLAST